MAKRDTRLKIIEAGARIIHEKGFNNTGIQEILKAAEVPKGSFYFYFKSKDDFGLELVDYFQALMQSRMDEHFNSPATPGLKGLKSLFDEFLDFFRHTDGRLGCPVGNLTQEMGDINPQFRQRLEMALNEMKAGIQGCLETARSRDEMDASLDLSETADFIVNSWEGALVRMKAMKSVEPLIIFDKMIFKFLKGA
jgi:TetR/AcrR family transcriptional regulator, transcriptional repressor for nem operon